MLLTTKWDYNLYHKIIIISIINTHPRHFTHHTRHYYTAYALITTIRRRYSPHVKVDDDYLSIFTPEIKVARSHIFYVDVHTSSM